MRLIQTVFPLLINALESNKEGMYSSKLSQEDWNIV